MTDTKTNDKAIDRKYSQDELNKRVTDARESYCRHFPKVEFDYNPGTVFNTFTPGISLKISGGDPEFIRQLATKLMPMVNDAISEMKFPDTKAN